MSHSPSQKTLDTCAICAWLGVPPDQWPPDHYTLLGLPPGECSAERLEQNVQQRLECVRRYQLTNPDAATEAMNRLAQAFLCLTDAQARRAYDCLLFGTPPVAATETPRNGIPAPSPSPSPPAVPLQDTQPSFRRDTDTSPAYQPTLLDLSPVETPERSRELLAVPAATVEEEVGDPELLALVEEEVRAEERRVAAMAQPAAPAADAPPAPAVPEAPAEPPDPFVEAARSSQPARRGLGTKRALYFRIARTRALLRVWEQAGKYLNQPTRRLARPAEAREFLELLASIRRLLENFPPLLGEAGQPGYLVVALTRQQIVVPTFQTLLPSQREALARDWAQAQRMLAAHKDFLRQELYALRRKTHFGRGLRAARAFLNEHPGGFLLLLGLLALAVAVWREYF